MQKIQLFIFYSFFIINVGGAQNYVFKQITTTEGLSSNLVLSASFDDEDYLWISTENGMNRYDGNIITDYHEKFSKIYSSLFVSPIFKIENHYYFLNNYNDLFLITKEHLPKHVFFNSKQGLIFLRQRSFNRIIKLNEFLSNINVDTLDIEGTYSILGNNLLIYKKNDYIHLRDFSTQNDQPLKKSKGFILLSSNKLNFAYKIDEKILYRIDYDKESNKVFFNARRKTVIEFDTLFSNSNNEYTIGVKGENAYILSLDSLCNINVDFLCKMPIELSIVNEIKYNQKNRIVLISTNGHGLYIGSSNYMNHIKPSHSENLEYFTSLIETDSSNFWVRNSSWFTRKSNVINFEETIPNFKSSFKLNDSICMFHLMNGDILCYNLKSKESFKRFNISRDKSITSIFLKNNSRYYNVSSEGIREMTNNKDSFLIKFNFNKGNFFIRDAILESDSILFLGGDGLYKWNLKTRRWITLDTQKLKSILCIRKYNGGYFICNYESGLWLYKDERLLKIPSDKFNYMRYILSIDLDSNGNVWIVCNSAIIKTSIQELDFICQNDAPQYLSGYIFDKRNTYFIDEFVGGFQGSSYKGKSGELYWAMTNGILSVDPLKFKTYDNEVIDIYISKGLKDSLISEIKSTIQISSSDNILKIFSPNWNLDQGKLFTYRIYSDQSDSSKIRWLILDLEKSNEIMLSNFEHGIYFLEYKWNNSKENRIEFKKIKFSIPTPWYYSKIAKIVYLLIILSLFYLMVYFRNRYLEKENIKLKKVIDEQTNRIFIQNTLLEKKITELENYQEKLERNYAIKNKLIGIISHDLLTPLHFIHNSTKGVISNLTPSNEKYINNLFQNICETSLNMYEMAKSLLDWVKMNSLELKFEREEFDIKQLVENIIQMALPMAKGKNIILKNVVQEKILFHYQKSFQILLYQIIINAIKYSSQGSVFISSKNNPNKFELSIEDEGMGMPVEFLCQEAKMINFNLLQQSNLKGFGLYIINDMLEILNAKITIERRSGNGTKVIIILDSGYLPN